MNRNEIHKITDDSSADTTHESQITNHKSRITNHENAIEVKNLTKIYKLYDKPKYRLYEAFHPLRKKYHKDFYALNDVSFNVKKGETVGIIGKNGSGKSTLLQILTGVLTPSGGTVKVNGRVSALLELGAGFNPEFTGIENVYFQGALMGFSKHEMDEKLDDILGFADIGDFVHQPVRMYSSGMYVRLAFAVAIMVDPDILIVDEALAVGDIRFQLKCLDRINQMKKNGTSIILVTHTNPGITDWTILLEKGSEIYRGKTVDVWNYYHKLMTNVDSHQVISCDSVDNNEQSDKNANNDENSFVEKHAYLLDENNLTELKFKESPDFIKRVKKNRFGTGEVRFVNSELLDENGNHKTVFEHGEWLVYRLHLSVLEDVPFLALGLQVKNTKGMPLLGQETWQRRMPMVCLKKGDQIICEFQFQIILAEGDYTLTVGSALKNISIPGPVEYVEFIDNCDLFKVISPRMSFFAYYYQEIPIQINILRKSSIDNFKCKDITNYYKSISEF